VAIPTIQRQGKDGEDDDYEEDGYVTHFTQCLRRECLFGMRPCR
jgi:hypothetical protein